jgi:ketosteroid isomerase-like protein
MADVFITSPARSAVLAFFDAFWRADLHAVANYLAPGAKFLMMPTVADVRENDARAAIKRIVDTMFIAFDKAEGLSCEITAMLEDGDRIAMEYTARAKTVNGERYENFYSAHLTVRDGLITSLATYADTQYLTTKLLS